MDLLKWTFSKKNDNELKIIEDLKKSIPHSIDTFNNFFTALNKKNEILENIDYDNFPNFFYGSNTHKKIKIVNESLNIRIGKILSIEKFDEKLLKHLLINSSTKLHQISENLGIKSFTESDSSFNLEEGKRRSLEILKNEQAFNNLIKSLESEFEKIKKQINQYKKFISTQEKIIENKHSENIKNSLLEEKIMLEKDLLNLKKFILTTLAKSKQFIEERSIDINKKSVNISNNDPNKSIIIFHSIANTNQENKEMSGFFANEGYSVFAPRFPGHGTNEDEFYNTSIEEIMNFSQKALDNFYEKNERKPVFITGTSLGGLVSLYLASKQENYDKIKGVIPINAFIRSADKGAQMIEKIPDGFSLVGKLVNKLKLKSVNKKSLPLLAKIALHNDHMKKINKKISEPELNKTFEEKLVEEFKSNLIEEYKELLEEQINERPNQKDQIIQDYKKILKNAELQFRQNFKDKKMTHGDLQNVTQLFGLEFYKILTWKGMMELNNFSYSFQKNINKIITPILVIQSEKDTTVDPISGEMIYNNVSSKLKDIYRVPDSGHMLILEKSKYDVFKKIDKFIQKVNNNS